MISAVIKYVDGKVSIHDSAAKEVGTSFSPGFYEATIVSGGGVMIQECSLSELHTPFRSPENIMLIDTVNGFFADGVKEKINTLGFIHKLGILLFGRQGTGKTATMHYIADALVKEKGAVVFFCNTTSNLSAAVTLAAAIREIQDNPLVFIADEFERYAKDAESEMKNFLDGNKSVNNTLFLAATNYIDKVPETLKKRPSRFKVVKEVMGITDKSVIKGVITTISDKISPGLFTEHEIDTLVGKAADITLDEIKHLCLDKATSVYCGAPITRHEVGFKIKKEEEEQVIQTTGRLSFSFGMLDLTLPKVNPESNISNPVPVKVPAEEADKY